MRISAGDRLVHVNCPGWGLGEVLSSDGLMVHIRFEGSGTIRLSAVVAEELLERPRSTMDGGPSEGRQTAIGVAAPDAVGTA